MTFTEALPPEIVTAGPTTVDPTTALACNPDDGIDPVSVTVYVPPDWAILPVGDKLDVIAYPACDTVFMSFQAPFHWYCIFTLRAD